jgi:hypothetical protein
MAPVHAGGLFIIVLGGESQAFMRDATGTRPASASASACGLASWLLAREVLNKNGPSYWGALAGAAILRDRGAAASSTHNLKCALCRAPPNYISHNWKFLCPRFTTGADLPWFRIPVFLRILKPVENCKLPFYRRGFHYERFSLRVAQMRPFLIPERKTPQPLGGGTGAVEQSELPVRDWLASNAVSGFSFPC